MDDLARRAIGELTKRVEDLENTVKSLITHQNQTDKALIGHGTCINKLTGIAEQIAARLSGVA